MRKLSGTENRVVAVLLALLVLVLAWFVLLQWWFVSPLLNTNAQIQDLRQSQQRYAAIVAQHDVLRHRLRSLSRGQSDTHAFLPGADSNAATVGLMQHVVDTVTAHAALGPCTVTQKMPVPSNSSERAPYRKVSANINMRCSMHTLAAVLHDLAWSQPYVFIDSFSAYRNPRRNRDGSAQPLNVQMLVSGYMRAPSQGGKP